MQNFLVGQVWEGFEFNVVDQINEGKQAVAFSPSAQVVSHRSRWSKKNIFTITPLFPGYVFIQFVGSCFSVQYLQGVKGFTNLVRCGEYAAEVRPNVMMKVIDAELDEFKLNNPKAELVRDAATKKIMLKIGGNHSMKGLEGEMVGFDPKKRQASIQLELFGSTWPATVDISEITNLPPELLAELEK
jgi:transcription antitermination factor NusG